MKSHHERNLSEGEFLPTQFRKDKIYHPHVEHLKKKRNLSTDLNSNKHIHSTGQIFEIGRLFKNNISWDQPDKFIGEKLWTNYFHDKTLRDNQATRKLLQQNQRKDSIDSENHKKWVLDNKSKATEL
jgi:hypothetical protein